MCPKNYFKKKEKIAKTTQKIIIKASTIFGGFWGQNYFFW